MLVKPPGDFPITGSDISLEVLADVGLNGNLPGDDLLDHDQLGVEFGDVAEIGGDLENVVQGPLAVAREEGQAAEVPELGEFDLVGNGTAAVVDVSAEFHWVGNRVLHAS